MSTVTTPLDELAALKRPLTESQAALDAARSSLRKVEVEYQGHLREPSYKRDGAYLVKQRELEDRLVELKTDVEQRALAHEIVTEIVTRNLRESFSEFTAAMYAEMRDIGAEIDTHLAEIASRVERLAHMHKELQSLRSTSGFRAGPNTDRLNRNLASVLVYAIPLAEMRYTDRLYKKVAPSVAELYSNRPMEKPDIEKPDLAGITADTPVILTDDDLTPEEIARRDKLAADDADFQAALDHVFNSAAQGFEDPDGRVQE